MLRIGGVVRQLVLLWLLMAPRCRANASSLASLVGVRVNTHGILSVDVTVQVDALGLGGVCEQTRTHKHTHAHRSPCDKTLVVTVEEAAKETASESSSSSTSAPTVFLEEVLWLDWQTNHNATKTISGSDTHHDIPQCWEATASFATLIPLNPPQAHSKHNITQATTRASTTSRTWTLIVALWEQHQDSTPRTFPAGRRLLTRRLATLPRATASTQKAFNPIAKVELRYVFEEDAPASLREPLVATAERPGFYWPLLLLFVAAIWLPFGIVWPQERVVGPVIPEPPLVVRTLRSQQEFEELFSEELFSPGSHVPSEHQQQEFGGLANQQEGPVRGHSATDLCQEETSEAGGSVESGPSDCPSEGVTSSGYFGTSPVAPGCLPLRSKDSNLQSCVASRQKEDIAYVERSEENRSHHSGRWVATNSPEGVSHDEEDSSQSPSTAVTSNIDPSSAIEGEGAETHEKPFPKTKERTALLAAASKLDGGGVAPPSSPVGQHDQHQHQYLDSRNHHLLPCLGSASDVDVSIQENQEHLELSGSPDKLTGPADSSKFENEAPSFSQSDMNAQGRSCLDGQSDQAAVSSAKDDVSLGLKALCREISQPQQLSTSPVQFSVLSPRQRGGGEILTELSTAGKRLPELDKKELHTTSMVLPNLDAQPDPIVQLKQATRLSQSIAQPSQRLLAALQENKSQLDHDEQNQVAVGGGEWKLSEIRKVDTNDRDPISDMGKHILSHSQSPLENATKKWEVGIDTDSYVSTLPPDSDQLSHGSFKSTTEQQGGQNADQIGMSVPSALEESTTCTGPYEHVGPQTIANDPPTPGRSWLSAKACASIDMATLSERSKRALLSPNAPAPSRRVRRKKNSSPRPLDQSSETGYVEVVRVEPPQTNNRKKSRPFASSQIVPDWVPSKGLQSVSQTFMQDQPWNMASSLAPTIRLSNMSTVPKSIKIIATDSR